MFRAEVADVEEGVLPLLGRILQRDLGEIRPRPLRDDGGAAIGELPGRRALLLQGEEVRPEVDRGLDPQVPLAERDEAGKLDDGAGANMVRLEPEELQERAEEGARWQPKSALEVREEDHTLLLLRLRPLLAARQANANFRLPWQSPR